MDFASLPKPRKKIIISISTTLAIALGLVAFVVWPSIQQIRGYSQKIDEQRVELETLYLRGRLMKKTLREFHEVEPKMATLNQLYVKRGDELSFITTLEALETKLDVKQDISLGDSEAGDKLAKLPLQLTVSGSLLQIIQYVNMLESLDYYVNLTTIRLQSNQNVVMPGQPTTKGSVTALLLGNAFYQP